MPATESIARRYAADIGFAVVGELTRKPEWDGVAAARKLGCLAIVGFGWMRAATLLRSR